MEQQQGLLVLLEAHEQLVLPVIIALKVLPPQLYEEKENIQ